MGKAPLPLGDFLSVAWTFLWLQEYFAVGKSPVGGSETEGINMLPLLVFTALQASVSIECFACLGTQFGGGIVGLCYIASFLPSPC